MKKLIVVLTVVSGAVAFAQEKPLTQQQVQSVVSKNMGDVKSCMKQHGSPTGKLVVEITVDAQGKVKQSKATHNSSNAGVDKCMANAIAKWQFPKPRGNGDYIFDYPFVFTAPKEVKEGHIDEKDVVSTVQAKKSEWIKCYDDSVQPNKEGKKDVEGKVTVGIVISPEGKVSEAHVLSSTTKTPKLDECVVAKVKTWVFPKPQGGEAAVACPFAFVPADAKK